MIRPVLRMGDPRLLAPSARVEQFDTPTLHALLADMRDTMAHLNGAGLAAPQIGVGLQVVIFGGAPSSRYPDAAEVPDTVLINPILESIGTEEEGAWEGCLSVPGMRGWVLRTRRLRYRGFNEHGEPIDRTAEGFHARVVQHECDHLAGILYPMRIRDLSRFGFNEALFPDESVSDD